MSILTEDDVNEICSLLEEDKLSATDIINKLKLYEKSSNPIALVSAIRAKKIWTNISDKYNMPLGVHGRVFNDGQIHQICKMLEHNPYCTSQYILYHLGIQPKDNLEYRKYRNTISMIRCKRRYTYISDNYNFQF